MSEARTRQRELPSVDRLLTHPRTAVWLADLNREYVTRCCREVLERFRAAIAGGELRPEAQIDDDSILAQVERRIESDREPSLRPVINATGTVLHTNLGRAMLAPSAIDAICRVASRPANLEYDLEKGGRGKREAMIERLLVWLTGAEAATCVNNNAAAVLIAVNTLANGKEVVVSRGELVEIGGAFRIPDILAKSGATLREVGTTNRTHPGDYERAIGPNTGLLLKVHASNYRIVGFSADVPLNELVDIGRRHNVPVMEDLGSGALVDLSQYGLPKEPLVSQRVACGADVVTFSGDKLLGGPQAGLVVGTRRWLTEIATKSASPSRPVRQADDCGARGDVAAVSAVARYHPSDSDAAGVDPFPRRDREAWRRGRSGPSTSARVRVSSVDGGFHVADRERRAANRRHSDKGDRCGQRRDVGGAHRRAVPRCAPRHHRPDPRRAVPSRPADDLQRRRIRPPMAHYRSGVITRRVRGGSSCIGSSEPPGTSITVRPASSRR